MWTIGEGAAINGLQTNSNCTGYFLCWTVLDDGCLADSVCLRVGNLHSSYGRPLYTYRRFWKTCGSAYVGQHSAVPAALETGEYQF